MQKFEGCLLVSICLVVFVFVIGLNIYDVSELTHHQYSAILADKWHEDACTPIFDGNSNYLGDSCSDEYTVVLNVENKRIQRRISFSTFKEFPVGSKLQYSFDTGKLGIEHNVSIIGEK